MPNTPFYPAGDTTLQVVNETLREIRDRIGNEGSTGTIYGFHIDSSESDPSAAVTYLKDAIGMTPAKMNYSSGAFDWGSWRDAFFIPRPCMLKYDGTVDYYLKETDYSKKEDGTNSDVANPNYSGNAMMEWGRNGKKIWYKIVPDEGDDTSASIYVADYQADGDFHAWSFINAQNNLVDHFYTPCYFGTIIDGKLRSLSGQSGADRCKGKNTTQERELAFANYADAPIWDIETYADTVLIQILLILMGKSLNVQATCGEGLTTGGSETINDGFTSGQHDAKGLFFGTNSGAAATYSNAVKVFGMENYWAFMWRRTAGLVTVANTARYKLTRGTADGTGNDDYVVSNSASAYANYLTGNSLPAAGYVTQNAFGASTIIPKATGGSALTYWCDNFYISATATCFALRGGASHYWSYCGFFWFLDSTASYAAWSIGASPSCKPLS